MTRTLRHSLLLTALAALALLASAPAASASSIAVQRDCADSDVFEQDHSRADLKRALKDIQGDVDEYTDCEKMILAELAGKASAAGNSGGDDDDGNSADLDGDGVVTTAERREFAERAERERDRRDRQLAAIDDELIQDDGDEAGAGAGGGGGSDDVPLPAILATIALACAGIGGGLWYASKRNPGFANTLRRVPLPFRNS